MSVLITDNSTLMQFVPNVLKNVQGELPLYEKIASHLEVAEQWLTAAFLSERVLTVITRQQQVAALRANGGYCGSDASRGSAVGFGAYAEWIWHCEQCECGACE